MPDQKQNSSPQNAVNKTDPIKRPPKTGGKLELRNEQPLPTNRPDNQPPETNDENGEEEEHGYSEQEGVETLGEQEHEMALKRQLDQQKKIDADFKASQEASAEPKKTKSPEQAEPKQATAEEEGEEDEPETPYTPPPGTPPEEGAPDKKPDQSDDENQADKEAAWQRKSVIARANLMRQAAMEKDKQKQQQAADEIPDPAKAGPEETLKRVFKGKCFSCTGCIGIIYRLILDFNAASSIHALLDMLWTDENTDKCFSCNCCCNVLSVILVLAAPILIAIGLALLAAKALDSLIDIKTIMEFLM